MIFFLFNFYNRSHYKSILKKKTYTSTNDRSKIWTWRKKNGQV